MQSSRTYMSFCGQGGVYPWYVLTSKTSSMPRFQGSINAAINADDSYTTVLHVKFRCFVSNHVWKSNKSKIAHGGFLWKCHIVLTAMIYIFLSQPGLQGLDWMPGWKVNVIFEKYSLQLLHQLRESILQKCQSWKVTFVMNVPSHFSTTHPYSADQWIIEFNKSNNSDVTYSPSPLPSFYTNSSY